MSQDDTQEGFDLDGMTLFRQTTYDSDAPEELDDDFSEGEVEFLKDAKKQYPIVKQMVKQFIADAKRNHIKLIEVQIHINQEGSKIAYGFEPDGSFAAIQDCEEPYNKYVPA